MAELGLSGIQLSLPGRTWGGSHLPDNSPQAFLGMSSWSGHLGLPPRPNRHGVQPNTHTTFLSGHKAHRSEQRLGSLERFNGHITLNQSLHHLFLVLIASVKRSCVLGGGVGKVRMRNGATVHPPVRLGQVGMGRGFPHTHSNISWLPWPTTVPAAGCGVAPNPGLGRSI